MTEYTINLEFFEQIVMTNIITSLKGRHHEHRLGRCSAILGVLQV